MSITSLTPGRRDLLQSYHQISSGHPSQGDAIDATPRLGTTMTLTVQAQKPIHAARPLVYDGAVDADGHILEPPDLWETYIDPKYRDRALRIVVDENGLEELLIDGERSKMARKGFPSTLGAMGDPDLRAMQFDPERTYLRESPFGAMDPHERLEVLDAENIDIAILYTTVGLLWEAELEDPELSQAYTRAYNRWICEFCADSPRLVPTAHLSLTDPVAAAKELERAVGEGAKGAYVAPFNHSGRPLGHPDNNPVFAAAQDLGVPFAIHPTFEPQWTKGTRMGSWENVKQLRLLASVQASDGVRHQFTTLFDYGVFDQFPTLKVLVLESGGGWIGYWLDRIDAVYGHTFIGQRVPLEHKPSDYFRERVWISCDPDERTIPALAERFGVERFMWASDFPHADHTPEYVDDLDELASAFSDDDRAKFLGDNARQLFDLPAGRP
jgi:predicted TIM-barrel fold metal-dependent hydrolase